MVRVLEAKPQKNYTIFIKLDNGKEGIFDVSPFLDKGIFSELRDENYFKLLSIRGRSISWPHAQDFCADTIDALMRTS
ncbi:MAG: DUF2442 domain-containing protein [Thermotogota bacterium]